MINGASVERGSTPQQPVQELKQKILLFERLEEELDTYMEYIHEACLRDSVDEQYVQWWKDPAGNIVINGHCAAGNDGGQYEIPLEEFCRIRTREDYLKFLDNKKNEGMPSRGAETPYDVPPVSEMYTNLCVQLNERLDKMYEEILGWLGLTIEDVVSGKVRVEIVHVLTGVRKITFYDVASGRTIGAFDELLDFARDRGYKGELSIRLRRTV